MQPTMRCVMESPPHRCDAVQGCQHEASTLEPLARNHAGRRSVSGHPDSHRHASPWYRLNKQHSSRAVSLKSALLCVVVANFHLSTRLRPFHQLDPWWHVPEHRNLAQTLVRCKTNHPRTHTSCVSKGSGHASRTTVAVRGPCSSYSPLSPIDTGRTR